MLELVIQQANSTVTTTVIQQTSGLSFLGLPLTDWITASTAVAITFFTAVTFLEGWRNRRLASVDKQLENFYNPVYEIMSDAKERRSDDETYHGGIFTVSLNNSKRLEELFLTYGHFLGMTPYLDGIEHDTMRGVLLGARDGYCTDAMRGMLLGAREGKHYRAYPEMYFQMCLSNVEVKRMVLLSQHDNLNSLFWMQKLLRWWWRDYKWRLRQKRAARKAAKNSSKKRVVT